MYASISLNTDYPFCSYFPFLLRHLLFLKSPSKESCAGNYLITSLSNLRLYNRYYLPDIYFEAKFFTNTPNKTFHFIFLGQQSEYPVTEVLAVILSYTFIEKYKYVQ